ncbi:MAG: sensor histidine kinase [Fusicatenibacter sp.]|nr:histidine kinase [Fusicatenibacter sp.]
MDKGRFGKLWRRGKDGILGKVKSKSLKAVTMRLLIPLSFAVVGLMICLVWGLAENRKLAHQYITDTARLYVDQINSDISQINSELAYLLKDDAKIGRIPPEMDPTETQYYSLQREIIDRNKVLKIRYSEVQNFFVYGQEADILISDSGTIFTDSTKSQLNELLMNYLHKNAAQNSQSTCWLLMHTDEKDYIVGWYARDKKAMGCIIGLDTIFKRMKEMTDNYEVIPFMNEPGGRIMMQANVEEKYRDEIVTNAWKSKSSFSKGTVYSYQLGSVGKMNLYVVPGGGILESILNMQIIFITLIAILLCVCLFEVMTYYQRVMEPMRKFAQELNEMEVEQKLNEDGDNNLLELESASGKFRELLRKIQALKISIYEKELDEQQAELEYTQEQIKPHFFLNCLSLIHGIADTKGEKEIIEITEVLSVYMRYIFQDSKKQRTVDEELEHINSYIKIQKMRYGEDAFSFEVIMDEDVGMGQIPSLLLQTLVENAVVHGVTLDRAIEISLYITKERYEDGEYLYICISDTGNGFSKETLEAIEKETPIIYNGRKHVGLSNIRRRLELIYGKSASIVCTNMDENYGAVVEVRMPWTE